MKKGAFIISLFTIVLTSHSYAKMDPDSEALSQELITNADVQKCYLQSSNGKKKSPETVILNLRLKPTGEPEIVAAINNPEHQTKDKTLAACTEKVLNTLRYPVHAKQKPEWQVRLDFPVKSNAGKAK